jgi:hypothetical protein
MLLFKFKDDFMDELHYITIAEWAQEFAVMWFAN